MSYPTDADAPPFDSFPPGAQTPPEHLSKGMENAVLVLAREIANLADAMNHLAVASQAVRTPPGASKPPAGAVGPPPGPSGQGGPSGASGEKTIQQKRGGLIWGQSKNHGLSVQAVAESVLDHVPDPDARKWSDADQNAVLAAMKSWGWIEDKGRQ